MPSQFAILCQETSLHNAWNIVKEKGEVECVLWGFASKTFGTRKSQKASFHSLLAYAVFDLLTQKHLRTFLYSHLADNQGCNIFLAS